MARLKTKSTPPPSFPGNTSRKFNIIHYTTAMLSFVGFFPFVQGCLDKASAWFEQNILIVAGVAIGIAVVLVRLDWKYVLVNFKLKYNHTSQLSFFT